MNILATCTEAGEKAFTCECGDTYTEQIEAIGHSFVDYVYNNDATYEADGTETATCVCGSTDTRNASGTKLELPAEPNMYGIGFETVSWPTHYSMVDTDVYFEPSFQGAVIGHLSINDEIEVTGYSNNHKAIRNYPPYNNTESPTEIRWERIEYNGQTGYIPYNYTWRVKRYISITLNPLAANYPDIEGGGSGSFDAPNDGKWYYVYGASAGLPNKLVGLNPYCSSMEIYDGTGRNVIGTITDTSARLQLTGNAYATYLNDRTGTYYIYEVYYNGSIAYIDSLTATYE